MCQVCGDVAADSTGTAPSGIPANYQQTFFSEASEILSIVDPIVKIKMDNKFFDKTESRQAEADDPGNQGTRDYEDPESPASRAVHTHQLQILLLLQCRSRGLLGAR